MEPFDIQSSNLHFWGENEYFFLRWEISRSKFWFFPWFPENSLLCVILRYTVYVHTIVSATWPSKHFWGWVEKKNKSELQNTLTYRVRIYIFEVRINFFYLKWPKIEVKIPILKNEKRPQNFFLRLEADFFLASKPFPR